VKGKKTLNVAAASKAIKKAEKVEKIQPKKK
jgi:hypothetical protein